MSARCTADGFGSMLYGTLRQCCWRHVPAIVLLLACALVGSPRALTGQGDSFPVVDVSAPVSSLLPEAAGGTIDTADSAGFAEVASDPLPTPSHRRAYLHLFIAFGIAWALILVYVAFLDRRIREARRDLERLEGR